MDALTTSRETRAAAEAKPAHAKSLWARNENALIGTAAMLVFLAFWEMSVALAWVNPLFTSSPSRILRAGYDMFADGSIYEHIQVSAFELFVRYGAALILRLPLRLLLRLHSRRH